MFSESFLKFGELRWPVAVLEPVSPAFSKEPSRQGLHPWLVRAAPCEAPAVSGSAGGQGTPIQPRPGSYDIRVPQSLGQIYVHAVFATQNREPSIIRPEPHRLHAYLVEVLAELGCPSLATGGIEDHVHVLHSLGRTHSIAGVMEKLKSNSSRWMKQQGATDFWWQPGYAAFSVSRHELQGVQLYIRRQGEHHRQHAFEQELCALCGNEPADAAALDEFGSAAPVGAALLSQG